MAHTAEGRFEGNVRAEHQSDTRKREDPPPNKEIKEMRLQGKLGKVKFKVTVRVSQV